VNGWQATSDMGIWPKQCPSSLGTGHTRGALVSSVSGGGPADAAGVQRGDVITAVDGAAVQTTNDLRNRIAATKPGVTVRLTVLRDGSERTISAKLDELPSDAQAQASPRGEAESGPFGLSVEPLPRERARALGLGAGVGLLVTAVTPGSPASDAGFQRGDVIEEVNGRGIGNVADLRSAVTASASKPALVLVRRGEGALYLTIGRG
jgi:serine protease Do